MAGTKNGSMAAKLKTGITWFWAKTNFKLKDDTEWRMFSNPWIELFSITSLSKCNTLHYSSA
jgi:hypothetical protein